MSEQRKRHVRHVGRAASSRENGERAWLRRVGIVNDYLRVPYANGSSFASQFLFRELRHLGKEVAVIGPGDPEATPFELPEAYLPLDSIPLRTHPGVRLPLPTTANLRRLRRGGFDLVLGQTCSGMLHVGAYLRGVASIPFVAVNTVHLPSVYNTLLPDGLAKSGLVREIFESHLVPWAESETVAVYNRADVLVVLSPGMRDYWRARGVATPIHVIPRAIEPKVFDGSSSKDPFAPWTSEGARLLVVCRHVREKELSRLLRVFARHILPKRPDATLTLVGDGPDHDSFRAEARDLGIAHRTDFVGERSQLDMPAYYRHADLFVYASLSETYGQVVSEALYSGLPVVAFDDRMGVSGQVADSVDGRLIPPGPDRESADEAFGAAVLEILSSAAMRDTLGREARRRAMHRCDPAMCVARYMDAFDVARERVVSDATPPSSRDVAQALGRWTAVHGVAIPLGMVRPPVQLNRNGARTPAWSLREVVAITASPADGSGSEAQASA